MYTINLILLFILLILGSIKTAMADMPISQTTSTKVEYILSEITPSIFSRLTAEQQNQVATMWHLSLADYSHYLDLMNTTPSGVYYKDKNLDPSWILGFNAKDEKERQKFVVIAIQNERLRVSKELAFQQEFDRLQRQLYPDLAPVLWNPKPNE